MREGFARGGAESRRREGFRTRRREDAKEGLTQRLRDAEGVCWRFHLRCFLLRSFGASEDKSQLRRTGRAGSWFAVCPPPVLPSVSSRHLLHCCPVEAV